jgi:hypothetical protein
MGAINTVMTGLEVEHGLAPSRLTRRHFHHSRVKKTKLIRKSTTVGELVNTIQPGSLPSLLLGECADGLPLLVELGDPHMGSILISCDHGLGKTHQLQVMADSAARMNPPSQLQLGVITFKPGEWHTWQRLPQNKKHLQGIYAWYDPWVEGFIENLVDLAEARQDGKRNGANVLLLLDDLNFIEELSFEAQVNLHWLLEYGAQAGIWVAGTMNAHKAVQLQYWVDPFRTRIIGKVAADQNAELLAMRPDSAADGLDPAMFRVWTGYGWRTYRLPLLGD